VCVCVCVWLQSLQWLFPFYENKQSNFCEYFEYTSDYDTLFIADYYFDLHVGVVNCLLFVENFRRILD